MSTIMSQSSPMDYAFSKTPLDPSTPMSAYQQAFVTSQDNGKKKANDLHIRVINPQPKAVVWKMPLPASTSDLLSQLYEALIMSKNCELLTDQFWNNYDLTATVPYTVGDIEHTLATIGVEINTQVNGERVTTGRWLLLRHSHFMLRAQHTLTWVDRSTSPAADPSDVAKAPVVWDWKSGAEKWRWHMWQENMGEL